jgi:hypothetical protein
VNFNQPEGYVGFELASVIVALLPIMKDDATAYKSFCEQLRQQRDAAAGDLRALLEGIWTFYGMQGHEKLFDDAHNAIRVLLEELEKSNLWGNCKFVKNAQVAAIARLP